METTLSDLLHHGPFRRSRRVQSKVHATPPSVENPHHSAQIEVVIGLSERDPELCLEFWQLTRRRLS